MAEGSTQRIDNQLITVRQRSSEWKSGEYQPQPYEKRILSYLNTTNGGPFRSLQLLDKFLTFGGCFGHKEICGRAAKICAGGWKAAVIPGAPGIIKSSVSSIFSSCTVSNPFPGGTRRRVLSVISKAIGIFTTLSYVIAPFLSLSEKTVGVAKKIFSSAEIASIIGEVCKLEESLEDRYKAWSLASRAREIKVSPEFQQALDDTSNLQMFNMMKSICTVSGFVLGLGFVYAGVASLSSCITIAAATSLAGTVLTIASNLFEAGMMYEKINFFDDKSIELLPNEQSA